MKKVTFKITGMTCEHCENTVSAALNKDGVLEKTISFKTGTAESCFAEDKISKEAICSAINQTQKYSVAAEC